MNVLIISHMYPSDFNRMSGIFVHKQVKRIAELGCNVKVVCPVPWSGFPLNKLSSRWRKYYDIPKKDVIDGIEVYYPRYIEFPKGYFFNTSGKRMYRGIKGLVEKLNDKYQFDLIHSHVALPDGDCGKNISESFKIPHIVTIHGQDFQYTICKSEKLKKTVFKVMTKADKVITVSNKLKNIVKGQSFYNKISVVNNGIDIEDNIINENSDMIPEDIDILSASNLIKTKGIDLNIQAINILVKKYPNIRYYVIGDGQERENLNQLVKKYNLSKNVVFLGQLNHKKVMEYMSKCKIFSMPSWKEGFGVVYIEAMLQGKPVIGVKGEGIEDVINNGENGMLVSPNNVKELAEAIQKLFDDKKYSQYIGNNAKTTVINNFTWTHTAENTLKIYNDMIR